jgi:hypothetical protein
MPKQTIYKSITRRYSDLSCGLLVLFATGSLLQAAPTVVIANPAQPSAPVGTAVLWSATASDPEPGALRYRWEIAVNGTDVMFRDYNANTSVTWAPVQEGAYTVIVTARNSTTGSTSTAQLTYSATSLLNGGTTPLATATANPLVAIYSSLCPAGSNIRVLFAPAGTPIQNGMSTPYKPCAGAASVNLVIAGMRAVTTYQMYQQVATGFTVTTGPLVNFTTGPIPSAAAAVLPVMTVTGTTSAAEKILLESFIGAKQLPAAYDSSGNVIWYNYPAAPGGISQLMRPLSGGTMVLAQGDIIQEIDLLGNIVHETNITRVSEQLSSPPFNILVAGVSRIADFNHEGIRLPDGSIATLAVEEKIADQGDGRGNVDVLGDLILVMDRNWQISFAWDPFTHLDLTRKATMNDTCASFEVGCPLLTLVPPGTEANDWTHANSLNYTGDGNLLMSMRNQDWAIKIDYKNGTGNVLWRFGAGGDFTMTGDPSEPVLHSSHQHDASLKGTTLMMFDNANATVGQLGSSRGLSWTINEVTKTAHLDMDARMTYYSPVVGIAEKLLNGNLFFLTGFPSGTFSQSIEFAPTAPMATAVSTFTVNNPAYRTFRMKDLYTP